MKMRFQTALLCVTLSACGTAPGGILKSVDVPADRFLATDSRLRLVVNTNIGGTSYAGQVDPQRIVCTEPSPDVATSIANSFGAGINVLGYGNAAISAAQVEGLVQLGERTATIQLLRDKMYRTCEAYANGAISATTYSLIMSRLDDTIVTLLLGETAGGAFGRSLAALGGSADAEAQAAMSGLPANIANLRERTDAVTNEEANVREAEKALTEHHATPVADRVQPAYDDKDAELTKKRDDAIARRDAAQRLMKDTLEASSKAAAKIETVAAGGGITSKPDPLIAATLRDMQAEFLAGDVTKTYVAACLVELGRRPDLGTLAVTDVFDTLSSESPDVGTAFVDDVALFKGLIGSELAGFCQANLKDVITLSASQQHQYRMRKADLLAQVDEKKYGAQYAAAAAQANATLTQAITECKTLEDPLKTACMKKAFDLPN